MASTIRAAYVFPSSLVTGVIETARVGRKALDQAEAKFYGSLKTGLLKAAQSALGKPHFVTAGEWDEFTADYYAALKKAGLRQQSDLKGVNEGTPTHAKISADIKARNSIMSSMSQFVKPLYVKESADKAKAKAQAKAKATLTSTKGAATATATASPIIANVDKIADKSASPEGRANAVVLMLTHVPSAVLRDAVRLYRADLEGLLGVKFYDEIKPFGKQSDAENETANAISSALTGAPATVKAAATAKRTTTKKAKGPK